MSPQIEDDSWTQTQMGQLFVPLVVSGFLSWFNLTNMLCQIDLNTPKTLFPRKNNQYNTIGPLKVPNRLSNT